MLTWTELQERLGVSESMLYFMRTGARKPSPKMLRRITELEREAGIGTYSPRRLLAREPSADYNPSVERKPLDIVAVRQQVSDLKRQIELLEKLLEDHSP
jgi:hypothetical protein